MKSLKFYKILVSVLVILNLTTLYFFWSMKRHDEHHLPHGPRKSLVSVLDLKGETKKKVLKLEKEHFRVKDSLIAQSLKLHESLFQLFNDPSKNHDDVEKLIDRIVENQRETEQMTFDYFKTVNALCTPEQKEELQKMIKNVLSRVGGGPPPPHRR